MNFPPPFFQRLRSGYALPPPQQTRQCVTNPAGTHLSFAETCSDERGQLYLTEEEWAEIEPLIPPAKPGGNKRTVNIREIVNGLMYILGSGCQWRDIPKDLPPRSTIHDYLDRWSYDGTLDDIHHALYIKCREQAGREASPTACVIDSQSVKSAEKGGPASIRMAMMRGRKSKARSGISLSIPRAC